MASYVFVFVVLVVLLGGSLRNKGYSKFINFAFFFIWFCFSGFRGDVGQDTLSYGAIYSGMTDLESLKNILLRQEPFLNVLMYVHKMIFDSYTGFLLLVAFIQVCVLAYATRLLEYRRLFLVFYLLVFSLDNHFNILRSGFAVLFFMAALSDVNTSYRRSFIWAMLAMLSHVSIAIVFPALLLKSKLSIKVLVASCVASFLVVCVLFFVFGEMISIKLSSYNLLDFSGFSISYPLVGLFVMIVGCLLLTNDKAASLIYVAVVLLISFSLSSFTDVAYRFIYISALIFMFLVFEERGVWVSPRKIVMKPIFVGCFVLLSWLSYLQVVYMINEPYERSLSGKGNSDFSYIPYNFYYESKYR